MKKSFVKLKRNFALCNTGKMHRWPIQCWQYYLQVTYAKASNNGNELHSHCMMLWSIKKSSIMKYRYMKDEYNQWLHTKDQTVSHCQSLMLITDSLACVYFNGFFKNPYSSQVNFNKSTTNIKYIYGFYKTGWSNSVFISSNFIYL